MTPLTFPVLRLLADGEFRSGEDLARALGVSRSSIWGALQGLEALGVEIFKVRGRGYRIPDPIQWLDSATIAASLGEKAERVELHIFDSVESTNTELMRLAASGAAQGTCIAAEMQSAGRGRRGRTWHAQLGGSLTFSILWRFNHGVAGLSGLSLAVGVAVIRALRHCGVTGAELKWPNDVLHQYRKLAGILVEVHGDVLGPSAAVLGIGLNLRLSAPMRAAIDQAATDLQSVAPALPSRNQVLAALLDNLVDVLDGFGASGFDAVRDEWQAYHAYQDKPVRLLLPSGATRTGTVVGVAPDGALLLSTEDGLERFSTGEVSLRSP